MACNKKTPPMGVHFIVQVGIFYLILRRAYSYRPSESATEAL